MSFAANQVYYWRYISEIWREREKKTQQASFEAPTPGRTLGECVRRMHERAISPRYLADSHSFHRAFKCVHVFQGRGTRTRARMHTRTHAGESAI